MKVFARAELCRGQLQAGEAALLLEGQWPDGHGGAARWSLDHEIDGRYGWIDERAAELAEQFATDGHASPIGSARGCAWLNIVKLRYLLVKLLRVVAFCSDPQRQAASAPYQLFYESGRDDAYWHLFSTLAQRAAAELLTHGISPGQPQVALPAADERGQSWRRVAKTMASVFQASVAANRPRIVFCGNPRLLAPVCHELVRRGVQPWWLTARFAPRSWLRWRRWGGGLLACETSANVPQDHTLGPAPWSVAGRDPDFELLAPAVWAWLEPLARRLLPIQAVEAEEIGRHLDRVRPTHVVVDQDGTPFTRALIAAARRRGVPSTVVQHGAPFIRFGFAPLVADRFCAWGETSAAQLQSWGASRQRIRITGTAMQLPPRAVLAKPTAHKPACFVLLATVAPADSRPDAVNYHLTSATYAAMIRQTLASVAAWPRATLRIKLHPRDPRSQVLRMIAAEFERLPIEIVACGSLAGVLRDADCVLSCASSAGIEAAARGWPVIQLLPHGSHELLEWSAWGLVGTARSQAELDALVAAVFGGAWRPPDPVARSIIAATGRDAASRIADAVLEPVGDPLAFSVAQPFQGWDPQTAAQSPSAGRGRNEKVGKK